MSFASDSCSVPMPAASTTPLTAVESETSSSRGRSATAASPSATAAAPAKTASPRQRSCSTRSSSEAVAATAVSCCEPPRMEKASVAERTSGEPPLPSLRTANWAAATHAAIQAAPVSRPSACERARR